MASASAPRLLLLDGGMGHLLRRLGVPISGPFGSSERFLGVAHANVNRPDLVRRAHDSYIEAGADVITTNSYACVPHCLSLEPSADGGAISRAELDDYIIGAGKIAQEASQEASDRGNRKVQVAGSLPPLGPSYRINRSHSNEELRSEYLAIAQTIAPFSDLFLCETMASVREGREAAQAAADTGLGLPIWVSFTLSDLADGTLRSGESIESAASACADIEGVEAVLVNCSSVEATSIAIPKLRKILPAAIRIGAYANGMETKCSENHDENGEECLIDDTYGQEIDSYAEEAMTWTESGASIVGGCCGIFPEHIKAVKSRLNL